MKNHVYDFYDTTSIHFSATRYSPWKKVMEYLSNLPNYSLVLDLGCANGKYFSKYEHFMIGCDICLPLLLNCDRSRVFRDNAIDISLRYCILIMIKTIFHIPPNLYCCFRSFFP
uniref:Alkylated DNA repair protein alkB homolog 8 (Trinotate prediction) n=1 Tax=Myxobolus squamalis TaxID=59785 RepID=A0A6B2FXA1_MYXSQ